MGERQKHVLQEVRRPSEDTHGNIWEQFDDPMVTVARPSLLSFCCVFPPSSHITLLLRRASYTIHTLLLTVMDTEGAFLSGADRQFDEENAPGDGTASPHSPNLSNINQNRRYSAKRLYLNVSKWTKTATTRCQWGRQWRQGWCRRPFCHCWPLWPGRTNAEQIKPKSFWLMCIGCSLKVVIEVPLQTSGWR